MRENQGCCDSGDLCWRAEGSKCIECHLSQPRQEEVGGRHKDEIGSGLADGRRLISTSTGKSWYWGPPGRSAAVCCEWAATPLSGGLAGNVLKDPHTPATRDRLCARSPEPTSPQLPQNRIITRHWDLLGRGLLTITKRPETRFSIRDPAGPSRDPLLLCLRPPLSCRFSRRFVLERHSPSRSSDSGLLINLSTKGTVDPASLSKLPYIFLHFPLAPEPHTCPFRPPSLEMAASSPHEPSVPGSWSSRRAQRASTTPASRRLHGRIRPPWEPWPCC